MNKLFQYIMIISQTVLITSFFWGYGNLLDTILAVNDKADKVIEGSNYSLKIGD